MIAQALAIGGAFFGGISQSMAKRGVQSLTPTHFLAVKCGASGAFFTLVALATQAWRDFQWNEGMVAILAASIVGPIIAWSMYTRALMLVDVAVAFTVAQLNLLWGMLLAIVFLGERPSIFTAVGAVAIIAGAVLVQPQLSGQAPGGTDRPEGRMQALAARTTTRRGLLLALGTSVAWGINLLLFRVAAVNLPPLQANWVRTAVPGVVWGLTVLYLERSRAPRGLQRGGFHPTGVRYAVATALLADVLDWTMRFAALASAPATSVIPLTGTEPLFAALFARFVLRESLTLRQAIGIGSTVSGVILVAALGSG